MFDPFALPEDKFERAVTFIFFGVLLTAITWSLAVSVWRQNRQSVRGVPVGDGAHRIPGDEAQAVRQGERGSAVVRLRAYLGIGCALLFCLGLGPILTGIGLWELLAPERRTPEEKAVAEIQRLNGEITRDETRPGRPVVKVSFRDRRALDDAELDGLEPHLQALTELRELDLVRAKITDEGLLHLKGLTHIKTIQLGSSYGPNLISGAAVAELRQALPQTNIYFYEPPGFPPLPPLRPGG